MFPRLKPGQIAGLSERGHAPPNAAGVLWSVLFAPSAFILSLDHHSPTHLLRASCVLIWKVAFTFQTGTKTNNKASTSVLILKDYGPLCLAWFLHTL